MQSIFEQKVLPNKQRRNNRHVRKYEKNVFFSIDLFLKKVFFFNRHIPEKWKNCLEQYAYIAEKKKVSAQSLLMHCEYFKKIKEQKVNLNQIVN